MKYNVELTIRLPVEASDKDTARSLAQKWWWPAIRSLWDKGIGQHQPQLVEIAVYELEDPD